MSPISHFSYGSGPIQAPSSFTNICYANFTASALTQCCDTGLYAVGSNATYCETNRAVADWQACVYFTGGVDPVVAWCTQPVAVPMSAGLRLEEVRGWAVGLFLIAGVLAAGV